MNERKSVLRTSHVLFSSGRHRLCNFRDHLDHIRGNGRGKIIAGFNQLSTTP
jgi:hypothetical protein